MLKQFHEQGKIEIGLDEAGRGCLFGPVFVAGVVWLDDDPNKEKEFILKDSKKCSEKKRNLLRKYIENNAIAYSVVQISEKEIDKTNILKATMKGMHKCIDDIRKQKKVGLLGFEPRSKAYFRKRFIIALMLNPPLLEAPILARLYYSPN